MLSRATAEPFQTRLWAFASHQHALASSIPFARDTARKALSLARS